MGTDTGNAIGGGAIVLLALVAVMAVVMLGAMGCTNQAAMLQPQIVTANGAAISGKTLLATGELSPVHARQLANDCRIADKAFVAALVSIDAGQAPDQTVTSELLTALDAVAGDLAATPRGQVIAKQLKAKRAAIAGGPEAGEQRKGIAVAEVITLIDLVVQLTPEVITEVHALFGTGGGGANAITAADCHAALSRFEADLTAFETAITAAGG